MEALAPSKTSKFAFFNKNPLAAGAMPQTPFIDHYRNSKFIVVRSGAALRRIKFVAVGGRGINIFMLCREPKIGSYSIRNWACSAAVPRGGGAFFGWSAPGGKIPSYATESVCVSARLSHGLVVCFENSTQVHRRLVCYMRRRTVSSLSQHHKNI